MERKRLAMMSRFAIRENADGENISKGRNQMIKEELRELLVSEVEENAWEEEVLPFRRMMAYYQCAIMEIETKFKVLNEEFSLYYDKNPIESIETRIKSRDGIIRKLKSRDLPVNIQSIEENIWDVAGLRVICAFPKDVYLVEKCLLEQDDIRLIQRKDYIANPKQSGYRSLHLIVEVPIFLKNRKKWVRAEIQLRTMAMDFWASLEHKLRYKKELKPETEQEIADKLQKAAETCFQLDMEMEEIRNKIQSQKTE